MNCKPIEMCGGGFAGQSLHQALILLGIRGLQERTATKNITKAAEKASKWLWIHVVACNLDTSWRLIT